MWRKTLKRTLEMDSDDTQVHFRFGLLEERDVANGTLYYLFLYCLMASEKRIFHSISCQNRII